MLKRLWLLLALFAVLAVVGTADKVDPYPVDPLAATSSLAKVLALFDKKDSSVKDKRSVDTIFTKEGLSDDAVPELLFRLLSSPLTTNSRVDWATRVLDYLLAKLAPVTAIVSKGYTPSIAVLSGSASTDEKVALMELISSKIPADLEQADAKGNTVGQMLTDNELWLSAADRVKVARLCIKANPKCIHHDLLFPLFYNRVLPKELDKGVYLGTFQEFLAVGMPYETLAESLRQQNVIYDEVPAVDDVTLLSPVTVKLNIEVFKWNLFGWIFKSLKIDINERLLMFTALWDHYIEKDRSPLDAINAKQFNGWTTLDFITLDGKMGHFDPIEIGAELVPLGAEFKSLPPAHVYSSYMQHLMRHADDFRLLDKIRTFYKPTDRSTPLSFMHLAIQSNKIVAQKLEYLLREGVDWEDEISDSLEAETVTEWMALAHDVTFEQRVFFLDMALERSPSFRLPLEKHIFPRVPLDLGNFLCSLLKDVDALHVPKLLPAIDLATRLSRLQVLNNNLCSMNGNTPLHTAVQRFLTDAQTLAANFKREDWLSVILHMIRGGADLNRVNEDGNTALMEALSEEAAEGRLYHLVKVLVELGTDLSIVNRNRESALELALKFHGADIVNLLISSDANLLVLFGPKRQDFFQFTAEANPTRFGSILNALYDPDNMVAAGPAFFVPPKDVKAAIQTVQKAGRSFVHLIQRFPEHKLDKATALQRAVCDNVPLLKLLHARVVRLSMGWTKHPAVANRDLEFMLGNLVPKLGSHVTVSSDSARRLDSLLDSLSATCSSRKPLTAEYVSMLYELMQMISYFPTHVSHSLQEEISSVRDAVLHARFALTSNFEAARDSGLLSQLNQVLSWLVRLTPQGYLPHLFGVNSHARDAILDALYEAFEQTYPFPYACLEDPFFLKIQIDSASSPDDIKEHKEVIRAARTAFESQWSRFDADLEDIFVNHATSVRSAKSKLGLDLVQHDRRFLHTWVHDFVVLSDIIRRFDKFVSKDITTCEVAKSSVKAEIIKLYDTFSSAMSPLVSLPGMVDTTALVNRFFAAVKARVDPSVFGALGSTQLIVLLEAVGVPSDTDQVPKEGIQGTADEVVSKFEEYIYLMKLTLMFAQRFDTAPTNWRTGIALRDKIKKHSSIHDPYLKQFPAVFQTLSDEFRIANDRGMFPHSKGPFMAFRKYWDRLKLSQDIVDLRSEPILKRRQEIAWNAKQCRSSSWFSTNRISEIMDDEEFWDPATYFTDEVEAEARERLALLPLKVNGQTRSWRRILQSKYLKLNLKDLLYIYRHVVENGWTDLLPEISRQAAVIRQAGGGLNVPLQDFDSLAYKLQHTNLKTIRTNGEVPVRLSESIPIRRQHLVEDALAALQPYYRSHAQGYRNNFVTKYFFKNRMDRRKKVFVVFSSEQGREAGIDGGGLSKELWSSLAKELVKPEHGLVLSCDAELCLNTKQDKATAAKAKLLGWILGRAVLGKTTLPINLEITIYAAILTRLTADLKISSIDYKLLLPQDVETVNGINSHWSRYGATCSPATRFNNWFLAVDQEKLAAPDKQTYMSWNSIDQWRTFAVVNRPQRLISLNHNVQVLIKSFATLWSDEEKQALLQLSPTQLKELIEGTAVVDPDKLMERIEWPEATKENAKEALKLYKLAFHQVLLAWSAEANSDRLGDLLFFVTAARRLAPDTKFIIRFYRDSDGGPGVHSVTSSSKRLPSAHTCFSFLDTSLYTVTSPDMTAKEKIKVIQDRIESDLKEAMANDLNGYGLA